MNVSLVIAYVGGLLTLFAPCAALMLPGFLSYAFASRKKLAVMTLVFFAGLEAVLVPVGFAAGTFGSFLQQNMSTLTLWGGIIIIVLGVWQLFALPTPFGGSRQTASGASTKDRSGTSATGVFLLGASYGLAGIGCAGPILGSVLTMAGLGGTSWNGALTMAVYGLGVFTPVFILAFFWDLIGGALRPRPVRFLGRDTTLGAVISGIAFIVLGAYLAFFGASVNGPSIFDANDQADAEMSAVRALSWVEDWMFVAALAVVVVLAVGIRMVVKGSRSSTADAIDLDRVIRGAVNNTGVPDMRGFTRGDVSTSAGAASSSEEN